MTCWRKMFIFPRTQYSDLTFFFEKVWQSVKFLHVIVCVFELNSQKLIVFFSWHIFVIFHTTWRSWSLLLNEESYINDEEPFFTHYQKSLAKCYIITANFCNLYWKSYSAGQTYCLSGLDLARRPYFAHPRCKWKLMFSRNF